MCREILMSQNYRAVRETHQRHDRQTELAVTEPNEANVAVHLFLTTVLSDEVLHSNLLQSVVE